MAGTFSVLAERERELLELKGPCSFVRCRLHYAHSGPCDVRPVFRTDDRPKQPKGSGEYAGLPLPTTHRVK